MWVCGLDLDGPGQGQVAEACECGNGHSGSIKCGEILDQLQTSQLLKKDSVPWSKLVKENQARCIDDLDHRSAAKCFLPVFHSLTTLQGQVKGQHIIKIWRVQAVLFHKPMNQQLPSLRLLRQYLKSVHTILITVTKIYKIIRRSELTGFYY